MKKPYRKPNFTMLDSAPIGFRNRRRSQRVVLRVAVVLRVETTDGKVQIPASTLIVNAHGGLIEASLMIGADQNVTLVNPQTGRDVCCRIVHVERCSPEVVRVALEFLEPCARFWPVAF